MEDFEILYAKAKAEANAHAFNECGDDIMIYPCGFGWVEIRPKNSEFAKWLEAKKEANIDPYRKCMTIWVGQFNQSMYHKKAYAEKMAKILRSNGIDARPGSRMD